ncbi:MAG: hypothetical protein KF852_07260 [Saprospiraceae bacterium]|nr:hypothetical protein [Saprospiraceae bacterium]
MHCHPLPCLFLAIALTALCSCRREAADNSRLPAFTEQGVNFVPRYPAGTYPTPRPGLPAPGHLGIIPSTIGEDGAPLLCLFISGPLSDARAEMVLPIAAVQWRTGGKTITCIIAVPEVPDARSLPVEDFITLRMAYDPVRTALEAWFRHSYLPEGAEWLGWQNEVYAEAEIRRAADKAMK